jgi:PAS domain S-box-containing protein
MKTPLRCLIVEDMEDDALLMLRQLRSGSYDVTSECVDTAEAMRAALDHQPWDVVLSDYQMPRFSGLAALELLQASGLDLPFIIVSGTIGEDIAVEAMRLGAHDYLMKGKLARLVPAVERELRNAMQRRARKRAEEAMRQEQSLSNAIIDSIPGAFYMLDENGRYVRWNTYQREEIIGQPEARIAGLSALDTFHPDDRANISARIANVLSNGGVEIVEGRVLLRGGPASRCLLMTGRQMVIDGHPFLVGIGVDLTERKQAEVVLRETLQQKEALLHEVHHRVKNNLQVISSLLSLEDRRHLEPATKAVLQEMKGRIRSMALLHETLYRTKNFARVDLAGYLRDELFRAQSADPSGVRLVLELVAAEVELDQAMPCGLLVNELLTNALKHGFPGDRHGEVRLGLQQTADGRVHLQVSDDGIGLPADFDLSRANTLGLQLVSDLTRQLQGVMAVGPGASFEIAFTPKLPRARKTNA